MDAMQKMPSAAKWQFGDGAKNESVRKIVTARASAVADVVNVLHLRFLRSGDCSQSLRERVRREESDSVREPPFQLRLQRIVVRFSLSGIESKSSELRVGLPRTERPRPGC